MHKFIMAISWLQGDNVLTYKVKDQKCHTSAGHQNLEKLTSNYTAVHRNKTGYLSLNAGCMIKATWKKSI